MSSVLATKITKSMINRAGYIPIESTMEDGGFLGIMDDDFMYYTFKDCLKVNTTDFHKWICYWDNYPFAIICDVKADKLANGYTKVAVLSKTVVPVSEVGEYPSKRNHFFGYLVNGKLRTSQGLQQFVTDSMGNVDVAVSRPVARSTDKKEKTVLSNEQIKNLKEEMQRNWGVTLK
ncbi:hypothetical protein GAP32_479 [Cronobacter phage vB_CsaM_GAP32]|uniref:Uncharacterized protein n=1 Tax=Cronobacter phage vB_CsaM_GAP32 TaxID=1141136 RepID=K4F7T7_9CAUD|nr:hypothetical protein GAP32_479 [Cronobacter phage vB_CsaM_GAP32]AFC21937.1 hypothetical protein GAP32_479 [Cronobacter phage vB_CsaM_GAP32]